MDQLADRHVVVVVIISSANKGHLPLDSGVDLLNTHLGGGGGGGERGVKISLFLSPYLKEYSKELFTSSFNI